MIHRQVIILGGGPAGLAAAAALYRSGVTDILILEREAQLGGVLNQCIHDGFGLTRFGENLTGPEYAARFLEEVRTMGIETICGCTVIGLTGQCEVTASVSGRLLQLTADSVILAMGCRERPRGALSIPGDRPEGVYTAGAVQADINMKNILPGNEAVILGSGDVGLIMARRLTLLGIKVNAVLEQRPYPGGLPRNLEHCLHDYDIPLYLSHTVTRINGSPRLESVTINRVDDALQPIPGTEEIWPCDTLILSAGLIPDNELSLQAGVALDPETGGPVVDEFCLTSVPGIFAAGNVLHVHDLVDFVSREAEQLAAAVSRYLNGGLPTCEIPIYHNSSVTHVVPRKVSGTQDVIVSFRPAVPMENCVFHVRQDGHMLARTEVLKATPAAMVQLDIKASAFVSNSPIEIGI